MKSQTELLEELKSIQELKEWAIKYGGDDPSINGFIVKLCVISGTINWVLGHYTCIADNIKQEMEDL